MHFLIAQEKEVRAALKAWLETFPILGNVFDRRRLIVNKIDFVAKLGIDSVDGISEIVFAQIDFLKFEDSQTEGFDDCPVPILVYNIHLFREFADLREDDSNSSDDFISAILTLRDAILNKRGYSFGVADPVTQDDFAQFGSDGFTDCKGHFTDLTLRVQYYGEQ